MAQVNSVKIKIAYEDATSRNYTFNGVEDYNLEDVKDKVIALNNAITSSTADGLAFKETFVSDSGAQVKAITTATIIITEQEVIYNAS